MNNSSEKIKNFSIAALCIVACIFLISVGFFLNKKNELQSELNKEIVITVNNVYRDYKQHLYSQQLTQEEIRNKSNRVATFINEVSIIASSRLMEEDNLISSADADILVIESINKIKQVNPRIAEIISILNKKFINNR